MPPACRFASRPERLVRGGSVFGIEAVFNIVTPTVHRRG
ncbi:hypothetical protein BZL30_0730 [Mycobacterium kansasii]|uniref:Uncharacterized protein n=1 Tax=Mycobacterium kansasii TaxID=1768 RepID=A0A1V3XUE0_MYCKA|nr:hypothetical protein BZL30_0730 [Mycobacterium kansasii]